MAYPLNPNSIIEVTIRSMVNSQTCLSVLHYRYDGTGTLSDGGAAILGLLNQMNGAGNLVTKYAALMPGNCTLEELRGQLIWATRYNPVAVTPSSLFGTWAGADCENPAVAAAITKRSQVASRHGRGTLHMPGVAADAMANGRLTVAYQTASNPLEAELAAQRTPAAGQLYTPVLYDRANPLSSEQIISVNTELTLRTMRRRVVGRGI